MEFIDEIAEEREERREESKKKFKKNLIKWVLFAVCIVALLLFGMGAAWMAGMNRSKDEIEDLENVVEELQQYIEELIDSPLVVTPVTPVIDLDIINSEIQEIGELATVEYMFTNAAKFTDHKQIKDWNIPLTEKSFTLKWDGVIKAGVKVDQIKVELNEAERKILVTIPGAEILSYDVDEDAVEVLDETNNKFNPITVSDKVNFDAKTEQEMKDRAIENGLLEKAQKSAEKIIRNILISNPAVTEDYSIVFVTE